MGLLLIDAYQALCYDLSEIGLGERLITFQATGERYGWYFTIARRLVAAGWIPPDTWGPASQLNTYTHVSSRSIGYLWEHVELRRQPSQARITAASWMTIPWKRYLDYVKLRIGSSF